AEIGEDVDGGAVHQGRGPGDDVGRRLPLVAEEGVALVVEVDRQAEGVQAQARPADGVLRGTEVAGGPVHAEGGAQGLRVGTVRVSRSASDLCPRAGTPRKLPFWMSPYHPATVKPASSRICSTSVRRSARLAFSTFVLRAWRPASSVVSSGVRARFFAAFVSSTIRSCCVLPHAARSAARS